MQHLLIHIPSISLDPGIIRSISAVHLYEERFLSLLLRLRDPCVTLVYLTSVEVPHCIVEYYLGLINHTYESVGPRLHMIACHDTCSGCLSSKILCRPLLLTRIAKLTSMPCTKTLSCFIHTELEEEISKYLNIPLEDSGDMYWGSKSGSRVLFRDCGVPHPMGSYSSDYTATALATTLSGLLIPSRAAFVVKLNQGVSGLGNAYLCFTPEFITGLSPGSRVELITEYLIMHLKPCSGEAPEHFLKLLAVHGGIVEQFMEGEHPSSPSAQGYIHGDGKVVLVSTHEQMLAGQVYKGCVFPASESYRGVITQHCMTVGHMLWSKGARGHYGVDYLVYDHTRVCAIEVNLRQLGTTHPMTTLSMLVEGYLTPQGQYSTVQYPGQYRCYVATDTLQKHRYEGLTPEDILQVTDITWDKASGTGTVVHLLNCVSMYGKLGMVCIGTSVEHAKSMFDSSVRALDTL